MTFRQIFEEHEGEGDAFQPGDSVSFTSDETGSLTYATVLRRGDRIDGEAYTVQREHDGWSDVVLASNAKRACRRRPGDSAVRVYQAEHPGNNWCQECLQVIGMFHRPGCSVAE